MKGPLVSIIIPVYNVNEYLEQCLDSVIGQTYKNLEIILVNDGSTDDSGKICDKYARKDGRIIVVHKENGGLSSARNAGIELMQGQYVSFIDSDDYVHQQYIEILLKIAILYKTKLVIGSYIKISDNYVARYTERKKNRRVEEYSAEEAMLLMLYRKKIPMYAHGKLYDSSLFCNIRFPVGKLFEDMSTSWEIIKLIENKIRYINIPLYFYRQRKGSIVYKEYTHSKLDQVYMAKGILDEVANNEELRNAAISIYFFSLSNMYSQVDKKHRTDRVFIENELKEYVNIVKRDKNNNLSIRLLAVAGCFHIRLIRILGRIYKYFLFMRLKIFRSI